jgi:CrcB protein
MANMQSLSIAAVAVGAAVGALARWQLSLWLSPGGLIPWGTLAANLVGGYLIGLAIGVFNALPELNPVWRLLLITGFLGGLTTFSSFSAEVVEFLTEGRLGLALITAGAHVLGSLLMTLAGLKTLEWARGFMHGPLQ